MVIAADFIVNKTIEIAIQNCFYTFRVFRASEMLQGPPNSAGWLGERTQRLLVCVHTSLTGLVSIHLWLAAAAVWSASFIDWCLGHVTHSLRMCVCPARLSGHSNRSSPRTPTTTCMSNNKPNISFMLPLCCFPLGLFNDTFSTTQNGRMAEY
jgi:hypothetical protein